MNTPNVVSFTGEAADRIAAAVRTVEGMQSASVAKIPTPQSQPTPTVTVKITGDKITATNLYPAVFLQPVSREPNVGDPVPVNSSNVRLDPVMWIEGDKLWVLESNKEPLPVGKRKTATLVGVHRGRVLAMAQSSGGSDWFLASASPALDAAAMPIPNYHSLTEIEADPAQPAGVYRTKTDGRTGMGRRSPSEIKDVPPIRAGQTVLASPSASVPGEYEITPWGSYNRVKEKFLVGTQLEQEEDPDDPTKKIYKLVQKFALVRRGGREYCPTPAIIGEGASGG